MLLSQRHISSNALLTLLCPSCFLPDLHCLIMTEHRRWEGVDARSALSVKSNSTDKMMSHHGAAAQNLEAKGRKHIGLY